MCLPRSTYFRSFCLYLCCIALPAISDYRLSDSKLLLPFRSNGDVSYIIRGSNGTCYEWFSGTPEVAIVSPIYEDSPTCSNAAIITAVWQLQHRALATIYAKVSEIGHVVKCDVIVDNIYEICIETTTQELYLHDTPEALAVSAHDEYGNRFSTLEGIPFDWWMDEDASMSINESYNVLRFLTWSESEYKTTKSMSYLESKGMQGYIQLVSGLQTGSAVVGTRLAEAVYANVSAAYVHLLVLDNARISPPFVILIPGARITLKVFIVQNGSDKEIEIPSRQYYLLVNDTSTVSLGHDGFTITAKQYGQSQMSLSDRNVEEAVRNIHQKSFNSTVNRMRSFKESLDLRHRRPPSSLIQIVDPAYLGFSLVYEFDPTCQKALEIVKQSANPQDHISSTVSQTWLMETEKNYTILINIFDKRHRRIYPSENLHLDFEFSTEHLKVMVAANKTNITVQPLRSGPSYLSAKLTHVVDETGRFVSIGTPVEGTQQFQSQLTIQFLPSEVNLPLSVTTSNTSDSRGYQLRTTGGFGRYIWVVLPIDEDRHPPVSVTVDGRLFALDLGKAVVVALDRDAPGFCSVAQVVVKLPAKLDFLPGPSEVVISAQPEMSDLKQHVLIIRLAMFDVNGDSMTDCSQSDVIIKPLDPTLVSVLPGWLPPSNDSRQNGDFHSCLQARVIGLKVGFTELEATYNSPDAKAQRLTARFSVAVYYNITTIRPSSSMAFAAVGSSYGFIFSGGPQPWPSEPSYYFLNLLPSAEEFSTNTLPDVIERPHRLNLAPAEYIHSLSVDDPAHLMGFRVRCQHSGKFKLYLETGSLPNNANQYPLVMNVTFSLICDIPATLRIMPRIPALMQSKGSEQCPWSATPHTFATELSAPNSVPFWVELFFANSDGHELEAVDSLTHLVFIETVDDRNGESMALVDDRQPVVVINKQRFSSVRSAFMVTPRQLDKGGWLKLHVDSKVNLPNADKIALSTSAILQLLPPLRILSDSSHFRLLLHHESYLAIQTVGGSGHYRHIVEELPSKSASTSVLGLTPSLRVTRSSGTGGSTVMDRTSITTYRVEPLRVSFSRLDIQDSCFPVASESIEPYEDKARFLPIDLPITVLVIELTRLHLVVADRIELGKQVMAFVVATGSDGHPLTFDMTRMLELTFNTTRTTDRGFAAKAQQVIGLPNDKLPSREYWVTPSSNTENVAPGRAQFMVKALRLGSSWLSVSTHTGYKGSHSVISSNEVEIHVFPPLSLFPCNFDLLLGAEYELQASGGPEPANVEFSTPEPSADAARLNIISISERGVLLRSAGGPGAARVVVKAVSISSKQEHFIVESLNYTLPIAHVISETECSIYVVVLSAVRIGCPLATASEMVLSSQAHPLLMETGHNPVTDQRVLITCSSPTCGVTPLWLEGLTHRTKLNASSVSLSDTLVLSPMAMSGVLPRLRFSWSLSPQPDTVRVAQLTHTVADFNVTPHEDQLASGMVLRAFSPGRVTVHLRVTAAPGDGNIHPLPIDTEISIIVLPQLEMTLPQGIGRQLLLSPGSRFQLAVSSDNRAYGRIQFSLVHAGSTQRDGMGLCANAPLTVSPTGVIEVLETVYKHNLSLGPVCPLSMVEVTSWPRSDLHSLNTAAGFKQSLTLAVNVGSPRYIVANPVLNDAYYIPSTGLLAGGPYRLTLTFYDQVGRPFDAVSGEYLRLKPTLHRNDLFTARVTRRPAHVSTASDAELPILVLYANSKQPSYQNVKYSTDLTWDSQTTLQLTSSVSPQIAGDLAPFYLTLPHGGALALGGHSFVTQLLTGQWECIQKVKGFGQGVWSSSDPSILWVESHRGLLLARRPGSAYLVYTLPERQHANADGVIPSNSSVSYIVHMSVLSLKDPVVTSFAPVTETGEPRRPPVYLPLTITNSTGFEQTYPSASFVIRMTHSNMSTLQGERRLCPRVDEAVLNQMSALTPIQCDFQLISSGTDSILQQFSGLPHWLLELLTWQFNDTGSTSARDFHPSGLEQLLNTKLEPVFSGGVLSKNEGFTGWKCDLKAQPSSVEHLMNVGLNLRPGCRIRLELKYFSETKYSTGFSLASTEVIPLPGFQLLVPLSLSSSGRQKASDYPYYFSITRADSPTRRRFLLFVPLATATELFVAAPSRQFHHHFVVNSRSPSLLAVSQTCRPVANIREALQILNEYADTLPHGGNIQGLSEFERKLQSLWQTMIKQQLQIAESEMDIFEESPNGQHVSILQHKLLWTFELQTSMNHLDLEATVVEVVVSLVETGQHFVIPVHLTMGSSQLKAELHESANKLFSTAVFTWTHVGALLFITILVVAVVNILIRSISSVSTSTGNVNKLDHKLPSPVVKSPGTRTLWSRRDQFTPPSLRPLQMQSYQ